MKVFNLAAVTAKLAIGTARPVGAAAMAEVLLTTAEDLPQRRGSGADTTWWAG